MTGPGGVPLARVPLDIARRIDIGGELPWIDRNCRRTDDLGRFRFRDLSPGDYTIAARPEWTKSVYRKNCIQSIRLLSARGSAKPTSRSEGCLSIISLTFSCRNSPSCCRICFLKSGTTLPALPTTFPNRREQCDGQEESKGCDPQGACFFGGSRAIEKDPRAGAAGLPARSEPPPTGDPWYRREDSGGSREPRANLIRRGQGGGDSESGDGSRHRVWPRHKAQQHRSNRRGARIGARLGGGGCLIGGELLIAKDG